MTASAPPVQILREMLDLDASSGVLTWRPRSAHMFPAGEHNERSCRAWNAQYSGKVACQGVHPKGYFYGCIHVAGRKFVFLTHRAVFAIYYGHWPKGQIDHINGNRRDNRIANLRDVSSATNQKNMALPKSNSSGVAGVARTADGRKWQAYINVDRRRVHLGRFADFSDAVEARRIAESDFGFHQNHGRQGTLEITP